jgi:hypothetical protein
VFSVIEVSKVTGILANVSALVRHKVAFAHAGSDVRGYRDVIDKKGQSMTSSPGAD